MVAKGLKLCDEGVCNGPGHRHRISPVSYVFVGRMTRSGVGLAQLVQNLLIISEKLIKNIIVGTPLGEKQRTVNHYEMWIRRHDTYSHVLTCCRRLRILRMHTMHAFDNLVFYSDDYEDLE
jgi:hypothetical protein